MRRATLVLVGLVLAAPGAFAVPDLAATHAPQAPQPAAAATPFLNPEGDPIASSSHRDDLPWPLLDPFTTFLPNLTATDLGRSLRHAFLAHHERMGFLPPLTLDALDAEPSPGPEAPGADRYRWARSTGDLDGDQVPDLVVQEIDHRTLESRVIAASGRDNHVLWRVENGLEVQRFLWPRLGDSYANAPYNALPAADLDGDGADDVVVFSFDALVSIPPAGIDNLGFGQLVIDAALTAHSGRDGAVIWNEPIASTITWEAYDPSLLVILNLPTGWARYDGPNGPRVLLKTTDVVQHITMDPACWAFGACVFFVYDSLITDHLKAWDARDHDHVLFTRDLLPTENPRHAAYTWLTGIADLGRGDEPDVVLDQWLLSRPQTSEYNVPLTGDPLYRYGRAMRALALNGDTGKDLWATVVFEESAARVNALPEEPFEELVWTGGQILGDLNGDGVADPLMLYLTVDVVMPGTTTGRFRTHFIPLDGQSGLRMWDDAKYQGWGFGASLATPDHNPKLLAVGTVDFLTGALPNGRFPPQDVHLAVLSIDSKTAVWDYSFRYAQDSGLTYQLTLHQFYYSLAPHDWDRDGVLDVVTPAQYVQPTGANQTLLANSKHTYQIFSGDDYREIYRFAAWGPSGLVADCRYDDARLSLVVGHSRRADLVTLDVDANAEVRRQPLYFDERPRPATAPVNLLNLGPLCDTSHGRELVSLNLQTLALGSDGDGDPFLNEVHSVVAAFGTLGGLEWVDPVLPVNVPLGSVLELPQPAISIAWWESIDPFLAPAGILPGATLGIALRAYNARRRNGGGGGAP